MEAYNKRFKAAQCREQYIEVVRVKTKKCLDKYFKEVIVFLQRKIKN